MSSSASPSSMQTFSQSNSPNRTSSVGHSPGGSPSRTGHRVHRIPPSPVGIFKSSARRHSHAGLNLLDCLNQVGATQGEPSLKPEGSALLSERISALANPSQLLDQPLFPPPAVQPAEPLAHLPFAIIDQKTVNGGIDLSLQELTAITAVLKGDRENIHEYLCNMRNYVFTHKDHPEYVIKTAKELDKIDNSQAGREQVEDRFDKTQKVHAACVENDFDKLIIPPASLYTLKIDGETYTLIVEQKIEAPPAKLEEAPDTLLPALEQFGKLAVITRYTDAKNQNLIVVGDTIYLPDVEEVIFDDQPLNSLLTRFVLFGHTHFRRVGLMNVVRQKHRIPVFRAAEQYFSQFFDKSELAVYGAEHPDLFADS